MFSTGGGINKPFCSFGLLALFVLAFGACTDDDGEAPSPRDPAAAQAAINKLPAPLRERFDTRAGRAEMERALDDKALLLAEARRRGLDRTDDVTAQLTALGDRLAVQALLKTEKSKLRAADDELRAFYDEKKSEMALPERVTVKRVFVATRGDPAAARTKADALLARLKKGEVLESVVKDSDGPERVRGGDYGAVAANNDDQALARAALALQPGQTSAVTATAGGFSILRCEKRLPARTPPFEEVRAEIENRFQPQLERRAFDQLLKSLRATGGAP